MTNKFSMLVVLLLVLIGLISCKEDSKDKRSIGWLISKDEALTAWIKADTTYFLNELKLLESKSNKNEFYGRLRELYSYTGKVIVAFDEVCQDEKHHIYKDLIIDSKLEELNKFNAIKGFRIYLISKLAFNCNLNADSLNQILLTCWPKCRPFDMNDSINLLNRYNMYSRYVDHTRPCKIQYFDTLLVFQRDY